MVVPPGQPRPLPSPAVRRVILHVDMDAFFVSVELLRRPELRGKPVVVGGTGPRGVVAAASYEARRFGVRSAMPSAVARRRCPQAVFLPGDHAHYADVSAEVFAVFRGVTPLVEGISLDEAFLDVSGALRLFGDGPAIAQRIRAEIAGQIGLSCSVGVAPSKFLAKLASEAAKPIAGRDGVRRGREVVVVEPGEELTFLHPLPVEALWGVGPATLERLRRHGVTTVGDLAALDERVLTATLGTAAGSHLHRLAWAIDDRPVEAERTIKSIGHEETYPHDLFDPADLRARVVRLAEAVGVRLRAAGLGARTVTLKVRFAGFDTITRSATPGARRAPVLLLTTGPAIAAAVLPLLAAVDPTRGVRLLGVSVSNFGEPAEQLTLGEGRLGGIAPGDPATGATAGGISDPIRVEQAWHEASTVLDGIRARFGAAAIGPASTLRAGRLAPVRPGEQQWGPNRPRPATVGEDGVPDAL